MLRITPNFRKAVVATHLNDQLNFRILGASFATRCVLLCIIGLTFIGAFASAAEPYKIQYTDPLTEPWRISQFPEMENRGLQCLTEDLQGNIWLGLRDGVIRYDGYDWTHFGKAQGLPGDEVYSIAKLANGGLAAATRDGLYQKQGQTWSRIFPRDPGTAWGFRFVMEAADGVLWACAPRGLAKLQADHATLYTSEELLAQLEAENLFDQVVAFPAGCLPQAPVYPGSGAVVVRNRVAVLSDDSPARAAGLRLRDRVFKVNGKPTTGMDALKQRAGTRIVLDVERFDTGRRETVSFLTTNVSGVYRTPAMDSVLQDHAGRIWASGKSGQLIMSPDGGETWHSGSAEDGMGKGRFRCATIADDGSLWLASSDRDNGISRFQGDRWVVTEPQSLGGTISDIAEAPDKSIWVASLNWMHIFKDQVWRSYDTRDTKIPSRLQQMLVASDGAVWIMGQHQSLVRIAMSSDEYSSLKNLQYRCADKSGADWFIATDLQQVVRRDDRETVSFSQQDGSISNPHTVIALPEVGVAVIGAHNGNAAVALYDGENWKRKTFPGLARSFSNKAFTISRDGRVWMGAKGRGEQTGGLAWGFGDDWQRASPPEVPGYCAWIFQLADGRMMAGGTSGNVFYDGTRWSKVPGRLLRKASCPDGDIDANGTVWLASRAHGVLKFQNGEWTTLTVDDGLCANEVSAIHADSKGTIWTSTRDGLCRLDGDRFSAIDLPENFGRQSINSDRNGGIWLDGVIRYQVDRNAPKVRLAQSMLTVDSGAAAVMSWQGVDKWNRTAKEKLRWSWRIDDGNWSKFARRSHVTLKELTVGDHTFQVRAHDGDANLSQPSHSATISVMPPFWMQSWFLAIAACLLAVLMWLSVSRVRNGIALRQTNHQLEVAREQISHQFAEKSAQFRAICDCSPVGIFVTDTLHKCTYYNSYLGEVAGISSEFPPHESWLGKVHPDDHHRVIAAWNQATNRGAQFQSSGRFRHDDGTVRWFNVSADRIERDGQYLGYVGVLEDVTEKLAAEEDLKQSNLQLRDTLDQLETAQQQAIKKERLNALGQMAAGVAHDINNALTPLMTYAELLERDNDLTGQRKQWLKLIRIGVTDTAETVRRLEHFYRKSHNRQFLGSLDIADVVAQTIELTRPKWYDDAQASGKSIDVKEEFGSQPIVKGNASQLRAVLTNLIFNAVDAISDRGVITVHVDNLDGQAVVKVVDDGMGMSAAELVRCTEPFYTSKAKGSGLGLSECHGIVRQHGGQLRIDSKPGVGTTVRFDLPCENEQDLCPADTLPDGFADLPANGDLDPVDRNQPEPRRILYIDDDVLVRQSTVALLQSLGMSIETADDGPAGLLRLEQQDFHLVMCDQGLPGMDGLTVLKTIKSRWPDLPVVMVSGWSLPKLDNGVQPDGFLEKPFVINDLIELIETHLDPVKVA